MIEVFGAGAVQSAYVSYLPLDITANSITLLWPTSYVNAPYTDPLTGIHYDILAASMQVTTNIGNVNTITLPDAMQSSVGSNFIITNIGAAAFSLLKSDGIALINSVGTGISYWIQLIDNTTLQGTWKIVQFGAGNSAAIANDLAGNGLVALGTLLNTDTPILDAPANVPPILDVTFRAKLILWTGAAGVQTLPPIGDVPAGYYVSFNNAGSAQITIQPGEALTTIDKQLTITLEERQSLTIISDGTNWWTLGFGQNQFAVTSSLNLDVSAGVNVTLTNVQASYLIQNYTEALGANITVFFPVTTNYWFINNLTTGLGTLSVQLAGPLGTSYVIPKGTKQVFYSNGLSLFPIPTGLMLADGSSTSPAAAFLTNPGTGLYNTATPSLGVTINGVRAHETVPVNPDNRLLLYSFDQSTILSLRCSNVDSRINYNAIDAITISPAGVTTLSSPLPLASGGTGATTQPTAANAILPAAVAESILVFRGGNWITIPPGAEGTFLKISGGLVAWV